MFKLAAKTAPFPYDVVIPAVDDRGQTVRHKIRFLFNRLSRTQFDAVVKSTSTDVEPRNAEESLQANVEQAMGFCAGWHDVTGADDAPLEFNADNLRLLFDHFPNSFGALVETYVKAWRGGEGARKN